jgi:hypothetical protein
MVAMRLRILIALLVAIPIEALNFWVFMPPLDVDTTPGPHWYNTAIAFEWIILHLPALRVSGWLEDMGLRGNLLVTLFAGGYLTTALLILAVLTSVHAMRRPARRSL